MHEATTTSPKKPRRTALDSWGLAALGVPLALWLLRMAGAGGGTEGDSYKVIVVKFLLEAGAMFIALVLAGVVLLLALGKRRWSVARNAGIGFTLAIAPFLLLAVLAPSLYGDVFSGRIFDDPTVKESPAESEAAPEPEASEPRTAPEPKAPEPEQAR